jgi:DNA-binding response OmpR family regulator
MFATMNGADRSIASPADDERQRAADQFQTATILLVDDDSSVLQAYRRALEHVRYTVLASTTGHSAIDQVRQQPVNLLVVDLNLPDMSGMEVIRHLAAEDNPRPFILVSGFLNVEISVEAMRLGACDVLEKPVSIERLTAIVKACLGKSDKRAEAIHVPHTSGHPASAAHRWAMYVLKGCEAEADLRTLEDWARFAGVSYSTLSESCRIIRIQPQAARDFTRALRAMIKSSAYRCEPSVLLDVSDRRTLKSLVERGGSFFRSGEDASVLEFIEHQRFVPISNEGIRVLLGYFARS